MHTRPRTRIAITALLAAIVLAACSGSKHDKTPSPSSSTQTATQSAVPTSTAPDSPDQAAVRSAYTHFVDPAVPVASKADLLQDGAAFRPSLDALSKTDYAKQVSLAITSIKVTSARQATVTFDVLLSGSPVVRGQQGYAVKENGTWKIAGVTFCGLLAAQGPIPAVCKTAAATKLPG